ncbi:Hsp70 family protein [Streptosporangium sp. NPDC023963]|uniref:Hsp70 family protein n=1 Tax=Streptosporangium sp. NPDC023963 TaxID=3155608 RepID=UPI00341FC4F7
MGQVIGIDLGTTYCAMAALTVGGLPEIIPNREGERITPSVVLFQGEIVIVGSQAKRSAASAPQDTVQFVKRHMGEKSILYTTDGGEDFRPEQISALILRRLKEDAELHFGEPVDQAVITVPAYFDDARRTATRDAGTIAGFEVLRVLNEPTAAAIAYGARNADAGTFLVYDLGGGTFDVTVMRSTDGELDVLSTAGDRNLGGYNWDNALMNHIDAQVVAAGSAAVLDGDEALVAELRDKAEIAKRTLSTGEQASVVLSVAGAHHHIKITRATFEQLTAKLLARTELLTSQALEEAGLTWQQIDRVLLVGGSTRMPMVGHMMERLSGRVAERGVAQDEVVAMGAAILAAAHAGSGTNGLAEATGGVITAVNDVTSKSLGIVTQADSGRSVNSVIVERNTRLPCKGVRQFGTASPDQRLINARVTEGDDEDLEYVTVIGQAEIRIPVPGLPAGHPVDIALSYDIDAIIHVQVSDGRTGQAWGEFEIERTANMDSGQLRVAGELMSGQEVV